MNKDTFALEIRMNSKNQMRFCILKKQKKRNVFQITANIWEGKQKS